MEGKGSDQNAMRSFQHCYKMCCKSENIIPLKNLILKNNGHILDFCVDRIKYSDWAPIFISLSDDISLHSLAIRCRSNVKTILEHVDSERAAKNISRTPVILTKFMLCNLMDSVAQCISQSNAITVLQLEGLPLYMPYIIPIAKVFSINHSLRHISLHGCLIGDSGCQKVCAALRCTHNVITLNLSNCSITSQGAVHIADLIKFLKIYRYSENWKQTLRYQNPELDSMPGLRRVTLSENPEFGDGGMLHIVEVLLDDLWIKAVDLQQCGLTEIVVKNALQLLEHNSILRVLDLRYNPSISMKSIGSIAIALRKNESNTSFDQTWLTVSNTSLVHKDQKFPSKGKMIVKKDKPPLQGNLGHSFYLKNDENRSEIEHVHINILKEQLKQEIVHRKQLEELNERLLQQVKELKQQQITQWKVNNTSCDKDETNFVPCHKTKQIYTINLNENTGQKQKKFNKSVCCNHKDRIGDGLDNSLTVANDSDTDVAHSTGKRRLLRKLNRYDLRQKMCSGADILEKLIEENLSSVNGSNADESDGCNNDFSSECSSPEATVRRAKEGDLCFESVDNNNKNK